MMEIQIQVKFSLEKIQLVKRNESAWNYLRVSDCAIKKKLLLEYYTQGVLDACTDSECAKEQRELVDSKCR